MKHSIKTRILSMLLALVLVISVIPMTALAEDLGEATATAAAASPYSLTVAQSTLSNLAPGVTEISVVAYDANGDRVQYFVVNANMATNETVEVKANYHDNDNTGNWGKATVVE